MKILISADMEGITGIVSVDQVSQKGEDYERARLLMTREVNAAIRGALAGGATEVIVNDSHAAMRNIILEELHPEAQLITGSPKPLSMMQGIDETVDAVFFIGYHARKGTANAILDHTYSGRCVAEYTVNGMKLGETGQNALIAGAYGVPVVLVTGDTQVTREARELLGNIETVAVKDSITRYSAKTLHPEKAHTLIEEAAKKAVQRIGEIKPFTLEGPYTIEIELMCTSMADMAELIPGVERIAPRVVRFTHSDYITAYKCFRAIIAMS
ncbi:peptidase M55 [Anoxybacter fermentans]|uniref:Peptidase M55 n=1 Tax=Anoxybacter fermentans TaxID=1323375 RepID=A0A3Q9HQM2_9FIRM|nr:M55 family metallopeptidase [Anoxybacter fermentans]AZR73270.1 peptidase M55 [Anoxybacter fermentans]